MLAAAFDFGFGGILAGLGVYFFSFLTFFGGGGGWRTYIAASKMYPGVGWLSVGAAGSVGGRGRGRPK